MQAPAAPTTITIDFCGHRPAHNPPSWDLPPWGHAISKGVLPLFIRVGDRLHGIGTAFCVGRGVPFVMTALHNVLEALRHEPRYERLLASGDIPSNIDLKNVGLYVLHQDVIAETGGRLTLTPLETVDAAPPTDVVFGYPKFEAGRMSMCPPLSFDPPRPGTLVWSIGYTDFLPADGIPMSALGEGSEFDWARDYSHRLVVTEGVVQQIFVVRFANGFIGGPSFTFNSEIAHGQSGGPVMDTQGRIVGINSAGATQFFNTEMSLASLLHPLLRTELRAGVDLGPVRINARFPLIDFIARGVINTDGSEENVSLRNTPDGVAIGCRTHRADSHAVFEDFEGFQANRRPRSPHGPFYHFKRNQT